MPPAAGSGVETEMIDTRAGAGRLARLQHLVENDLTAVNRVIVDRMQSPVSLIPRLAGHIVASGGKRIRPLVTLLAARCCGYTGDRQVMLAACVEFIHTATLLHDDVVDTSTLRRGTATANAVWGNQASVLVGDFLFSRAFELMVEDGSLDVLAILSSASSTIAEGEVLQLLTAHDTETDEAAYLRVVAAKTARLFAAAAAVGGAVSGVEDAQRKALFSYGADVGMCFQLVDDALDYQAAEVALGKTVGDDFREGKITLPVILAFARGGEEERRFWRRALEDGRQDSEDFDRAVDLIARHGAFDETMARAQRYAASARAALDVLPDNPHRAALAEIAAFAVERGY